MFYTLVQHGCFDQSERAQGPIYNLIHNTIVYSTGNNNQLFASVRLPIKVIISICQHLDHYCL